VIVHMLNSLSDTERSFPTIHTSLEARRAAALARERMYSRQRTSTSAFRPSTLRAPDAQGRHGGPPALVTSPVQWPNMVVYRSAPQPVTHPRAWPGTARMLPAGWQQQLFTHKEMIDFMALHTTPELNACFLALRPWAYRADLFRLAILHERGGIWMDFSSELLVPLSSFLGNSTPLVLVRERKGFNMDYGILNAMIGAKNPRSPFLNHSLQEATRMCAGRRLGKTPWSITGPEMLGRVAQEKPELVAGAVWLRHYHGGGYIDGRAGGRSYDSHLAVTKHGDHTRYIPASNTYMGDWKSGHVYYPRRPGGANSMDTPSAPRPSRRADLKLPAMAPSFTHLRLGHDRRSSRRGGRPLWRLVHSHSHAEGVWLMPVINNGGLVG